ncbi:unnamed protein product [Strongylus vulgaris]|uniref:Fucosyltransferase n=1 Tax=Strongylus vulgaris TaxID=40348 RepID=A0A3P7IW81_STRVU|nr:unnamed protein product [Strongylus vulgaris]
MTLGFRHDTPASSPYGYTVKLAKKSRPTGEVIDMKRVNRKSKGAAWFVSHCGTESNREGYIKDLQRNILYFVDKTPFRYHFYIAFENSICKDYVTEKLWNQGYGRDIIPIVLSRAVVEKVVPPRSFIAADDFNDTKGLADYLHYLMKNKTAYAEYFQWRREYKVVFLDGNVHDALERPWGFCQICRLLWEKPRPHFSIENFAKYWGGSCEKDGELVRRLVGNKRNLTTGTINFDVERTLTTFHKKHI